MAPSASGDLGGVVVFALVLAAISLASSLLLWRLRRAARATVVAEPGRDERLRR